jgi:hypothetical protein
MEMYGIEPIKRSHFDGILDNSFVKILPLNRVLNKMDIRTLLKNVIDKVGEFIKQLLEFRALAAKHQPVMGL